MIDISNMPNKRGICPFCGQQTLEYDCVELVDDMMYYPWECTNCEHRGEEWYNLTFAGHNIEDENGDCIITLELPEKTQDELAEDLYGVNNNDCEGGE